MKKLILSSLCLITLASCKNASKEVKSDETVIENPADTIVENDTMAVNIDKPSAPAKEVEIIAPSENPAEVKTEKPSYASFGKKITPENALSRSQMLARYKGMKAGDTVAVKFASTIKEVCKKKGCWMSMELANEKESFVRFKDYGFFVPLNAGQSDAIIAGRAFLDVISVAQLQHYAKDGGKSQEEIDKITEPKVTYAFQADGVLIRE